MSLNHPARFATVCPALQSTSIGLRCQHASAEVRPYWLRALCITIGLLLVAYIATASAWFGVLRYRGLDQVRWIDCSWPAYWPNIATARGAFFQQQANQALREGDFSLAMRALSSGFASCSDCWEQGLLLARLYEHVGQFASADDLFANLTRRFPEHHTTIALHQHDAMLASQRFSSLHELAWANLLADSETSNSWIAPLIYTIRETTNQSTYWEDHQSEISQLSPELRALLSLALKPDNESVDSSVVRALLRPSQSPLTARLRWELFLQNGELEAAKISIKMDRGILSPFEYSLASWATLEPSVSDQLQTQYWMRTIPEDLKTEHVERLCAVAINANRLPPLFPLRMQIADQDRASLAAIWTVASARGDTVLAANLARDLDMDPDDPDNILTLANARHRLPAIAAIIAIPREVRYALIRPTNPQNGSSMNGFPTSK